MTGVKFALTLENINYVSNDVGSAIVYAAETLGSYFLGGEYDV